MWKSIAGNKRKSLLKEAIEFTGDAELYGSWMLKVIEDWPTTCEHHLTDVHSNRKSFLGQAACALAIGCPEDITRQAWGFLTQEQQDDANNKAIEAIKLWETKYNDRKNRPVLIQMEEARLSQRNSRISRHKTRGDEQGTFI